MNLSLLLPAEHIKSDSIVYKVTGTYPHTLRRGLEVFAEGGRKIFLDKDHILLESCNNGSLSHIKSDLVLRFEFANIRHAISYLEELEDEE